MRSKKVVLLLALLAITIILSGCTKKTNKSFTYNVETGDTVKINMDTTGGYDLTAKLPIEFSKDGKTISQGTFGKENAYEMYYEAMKNDSKANLIEEKSINNIQYFFYDYDGKEFNYIIKIKNSKTCFILGNNVNRKSAQEIFEKLEFTIE